MEKLRQQEVKEETQNPLAAKLRIESSFLIPHQVFFYLVGHSSYFRSINYVNDGLFLTHSLKKNR